MRKLLILITASWASHASAIDTVCIKRSHSMAYVHQEHLTITSEPNNKSEKIVNATLGDSVCIIKKKRIGSTEWAQVQTSHIGDNKERLEGWVQTDSITKENQLKPIEGLKKQEVSVEIGDYYATYHIASNGSFKVYQSVSQHKCKKGEIPNEYGTCEDFEWVSGKFYGRGALAIAVSRKYGALDIFKKYQGGNLCAWQHGELPQDCQRSK